jgi:hypothetical protein
VQRSRHHKGDAEWRRGDMTDRNLREETEHLGREGDEGIQEWRLPL